MINIKDIFFQRSRYTNGYIGIRLWFFATLLIVGILALMFITFLAVDYGSEKRCEETWKAAGKSATYSRYTGCLVEQPDGTKIPERVLLHNVGN